MNRSGFIHCFAVLAAAVVVQFTYCASGLYAPCADKASPDALTVMTYNLRFASSHPPNAWPLRRPLIREAIRQIAPDVFGTQEGIYPQLKDMAADLPEYEWIGLGRNGGRKGEFMAVFYLKTRFELLSCDHFWLSDTPQVIGSRTWGNRNRRMVTMVKFLDRQTRLEFFFWNTHFDHRVQTAREKSAILIRERVTALNTHLPLILTGDFNAAAGVNPIYETLTSDGFFSDAWTTAAERCGEGLNSFNGFKPIVRKGVRIDWILTRGNVVVDSTEIVTFSRDGNFPSDHFPVVAKLRLGP
jgi:endonuclease/exonuclease/phosphatase family metal-dependent hydrolase